MLVKIACTCICILMFLSGCDSSSSSDDTPINNDSSVNDNTDSTDETRPPADAAVITTSGKTILDSLGEPLKVRGVNLQYGDNPGTRLSSIAPIKEVGANLVRLQLRKDTTAGQLRAALDAIVEQSMVAMVMLWEVEGEITCTEDDTFLLDYVENLWLGEWLPVLVEEKYQPYLMINVANEWGPLNVWDATSDGYDSWVSTYSDIIADIREAGFKVPIVIDAPHCGQDYNAFLNGRGQALLAADPEGNIILSPHAYHDAWNTTQEVSSAIYAVQQLDIAFIIGEFGDSNYQGAMAVDHQNLLALAEGSGVLKFDIPWGDAAADKVLWRKQLDQPVDLTNTTVSADVYLPQAIVTDGNLGFKIFVKDTGWVYASLGWNSAANMVGDSWNHVEFTVTDASSFDTDIVADGFDMTQTNVIGFELVSNNKPTDVGGDILLDNVRISGTSTSSTPSTLFSNDFATDISNWEYDWSENVTEENITVSHDSSLGDGVMAFDVSWAGDTDKVLWRGYLDQAVNLAGATVTVDIYVPQAYVDDGNMGVQIFIKDSAWVYANLGWNGVSGMTGDAWNTIEVEVEDSSSLGFVNDGFDMSTVDKIGVEFVANGKPASVTGNIYVDNVAITGLAQATSSTLMESTFPQPSEEANTETSAEIFSDDFAADVSDWEYDWSENVAQESISVTHDSSFGEGAMAFNISWAGDTDKVLWRGFLDEAVDLAGKTVSVDVYIPQAYVDDGNMGLQVFVKDSAWVYANLGWNGVSGMTGDDWNTIEVQVTDENSLGFSNEGFDLSSIDKIGVEFVANGKAADVTGVLYVDNVSISSTTTVDASDGWVYDWAEGSLSESMVTADGVIGFSSYIESFGWAAWSWYGNGSGVEMLDMSTSESSVVLTTRGEDIVNGTGGLAETSVAAGFPDVEIDTSDNSTAAFSDNFASDITGWIYDWSQDVSQDNITVTHTSAVGDGAIAFDVNWTGDNDKVLWRASIDAPTNLVGKTVKADFYIPAAYVTDGNMLVKAFVKDTSWVYANVGETSVSTLTGDAWNTIAVPIVDIDSFTFVSEGFNINAVNKIGIEFEAFGKPETVTGTLYVDNIEIVDTE